MALFDRRDSVSLPPEVAACEKRIAELEQQKAELLRQIGQRFLENSTPEELAGTPYEEAATAIETADKEREFQEKRMLAVQGKRKCEKCGNILVLESAFCNKCGEKLEPLFAEEMKQQNVCPQCGANYGEGAMFCVACGMKLG